MITAKDDFSLEREMIAEMQARLRETNLSHEEREQIMYSLDGISEADWDELNKRISDNQINDLDRLKNGETLSQSQITAAVIKASKNG